jgi:hypothetical protein
LATISFDKVGVEVISTGGTNHLFTDNGSFTFEYKDMAGNT